MVKTMNDNTKPNNIIAIASGKGGVGKTWLAVTLSQLIARSGRNVLLFDGDIGLANVDVQLGFTPQKDLSSTISGRNTLKEAITPYQAGGFDIIAGRSGSATLASLSTEKLQSIGNDLKNLQNDYDYVILDLGAGIEQHVQYLASLASSCVVVVTDEPTSLTDAYAFIKIISGQANAPKMHIAINQSATQKEGESTYNTLLKACQNFLKLSPELLGVIRKDNKVKDSIRNQTSILIRAPHSTAATDAAAISIKLMQR